MVSREKTAGEIVRNQSLNPNIYTAAWKFDQRKSRLFNALIPSSLSIW